MSRIGKKPITLPAGVTIDVNGSEVTVKGPKGELKEKFSERMTFKVEGTEVNVVRPDDSKESKALHGLTRTLVNNMVVGVSEGFSKKLEINGVGYRAAKQGTKLVMNLGYSHQVFVDEKDGMKIDVPQPNQIIISGPDKQKVGQLAAEIREHRPPEPYKGKGIKYIDEVIIRKEGKAGKAKK